MRKVDTSLIVRLRLPQFAVGLFTTMLNNYLIYFYQPSKASGIPDLIPQGRLVLGVLVLLIAAFAAGAWLNAWVEPQLQVIARQQTGIALNNIVQKVISPHDYDEEAQVHQQRGEDGLILTLEYDTYALNQILGETLDKIDASLAAAQSGCRDPMLDEVL